MSQLYKAKDRATTQVTANSYANSNAPRNDILNVPGAGNLPLPGFVSWLPLVQEGLFRFGRAEFETQGSRRMEGWNLESR